MMKTLKEMVKLDENNETANIKMPKTNFTAKDFVFLDFFFTFFTQEKGLFFNPFTLPIVTQQFCEMTQKENVNI